MTALKPPSFISIEDYLDGEDCAESRHEYLVPVYRRRAEGGFNVEEYAGREGGIELPEIQASLRLDELYDGITFG